MKTTIKRNQNFKAALRIIESELNVSVDMMLSGCKAQHIAYAKKLFVTAAREKGFTLVECGAPVGYDHSSTQQAIKSYERIFKTSTDFRNKYAGVYQHVAASIMHKVGKNYDLVYLCGQVTGIEYEEALELFEKAKQDLGRAGYMKVFIPLVKTDGKKNTELNKICLFRLLSSKHIYIMGNAKNCAQAMLEYSVAQNIGLNILNSNKIRNY